MSSSGLIYAVIVGAWAAYLVPMWLRRQDELNEARPTERFSTAIRLLSGRAAMERRYAKDLRERTEEEEPGSDPDAGTEPVTGSGSVDVRFFAMPPDAEERATGGGADAPDAPPERAAEPAAPRPRPGAAVGIGPEAAARARRSKVLARRRRTTVALFLAFSIGAVVAAVGGLAFLWAPAVPALLLSAYIVYLRAQERRRFTYTMDRRRAEVAAQRLRERRPGGARRPAAEPAEHPEPASQPGLSALAADRRALVEQTDHAEWVDQQRERERGTARGESWDPVPVPLPTYVTAPVAPRATGSVDLGAPDTWSSARSSAAEPAATERGRAPAPADPQADDAPADAPAPTETASHIQPDGQAQTQAPARRAAAGRRSRERGRTPLFDQYAEGDRPRAANE
ncbi:gephyrin-like molybdotransferase receptor GlpR [Streptomyces sp. E11-3]|uniref:divisome protein SepX/GlpR n=1 Tax=Streptomyces sp. E11-3 TaxID=3110112 RepID=UPI0039807BCC